MTARSRSGSIPRARPGVALRAAACALLAGACSPVRSDQGLAMLDVSAAAGLAPFTTARFSVAGRAEIPPHEIAYDGRTALRFGYYLPGPNGTLRVTGQALSASCLVGAGSAEVDVQLGHVSAPVALSIAPVAEIDPTCLAPPGDGGGADGSGGASSDGATVPPDAADAASADATTDSAPPPPPPACLAATKSCSTSSACCAGLACATTTLGRVCCGNFGMTCNRPGGEDCCGQLECVNGGCCLPATYACTGSSCCAGLVCGNTTLGRVCCGNSGAPCTRSDGADCCGALRCVNKVCRT